MAKVPVLKPSEVILMALSIPNHDTVARGRLRSLISKAGLTLDDFLELL